MRQTVAWLLAVLLAGCIAPPPTIPWPQPPAPPPVEVPPQPPVEPAPPVEPLPPVPGLPAIGTTKAAVEAAWGPGTDLPENAGERDVVVYLRTIDGREAEVHIVYVDGLVFRTVVSFLVTPGGG